MAIQRGKEWEVGGVFNFQIVSFSFEFRFRFEQSIFVLIAV